MNRRELLKSVAAGLPAAASVRMEDPVGSGDLLIIEFKDHLSMATQERLQAHLDYLLGPGRPKALLLDGGATARIERGVLRVERA